MVMKRLGLVILSTLLLWGCGGGGSDQEVADLRSQQSAHEQKIGEMTQRIESLDATLAAIQRDVTALLGGGSVTPGEGPQLTVKSDFAETEEYQQIMQQIATLQGQLAATEGEFVAFRDSEREYRELETLRDRGSAFRAMGNPLELSRRLDILGKNFSGNIGDAATRSQFLSDIEAMKAKYSVDLSPQQKQAEARRLITDALNSTEDERMRGWMERQLQSLDEASGDQLNERVDRALQMQKMREIGEFTQKYNIPSEVVTDSGIVSFGGRGGRGGPMGFGPRGGGGRGQ